MSTELVLLKSVGLDYIEGERICDWDFIGSVGSNWRVYYKPFKDQDGFYFYAVETNGGETSEDINQWNPEKVWVECMFHGTAYFDGVRHLYLGRNETDNEGYIYYPHLSDYIKCLEAIRDLETKYCPQKD